MKRFITIALVVLLTGSLFAQFPEGQRTTFKSIRPVFVTATVDSSDTAYVYVPWPTDNWDASTAVIGTTLPTAAAPQCRKEMLATGDVFITITPDSITAEESDSLGCYIAPIQFNSEFTWSIGAVDKTYIVFDTPGTSGSDAVDWLNWTSGYTYTAQLSNELWSSAGFVIALLNLANDTAGADATFEVGIYFVR